MTYPKFKCSQKKEKFLKDDRTNSIPNYLYYEYKIYLTFNQKLPGTLADQIKLLKLKRKKTTLKKSYKLSDTN